MINNLPRIGNYTSSEIVALTTTDRSGKGFGKPALTYIEETNFERKLGRSITDEVSAKPLTWGKLLEGRVFDLLGLEYTLSSTETDIHPTITYWAGSKDGIKLDEGKTVMDIKCPMTLKSFCQLVDPIYAGLTGIEAINAVRDGYVDKNGVAHSAHKDGEKYYWQLVSNSVLNDTKYAELIVYMPFKSELDAIKQMAQNVESDQLSKHYWISMSLDGELPFILDNGFYQNINILRFEVPQADKNLLTSKVIEAGKFLVNTEELVAA